MAGQLGMQFLGSNGVRSVYASDVDWTDSKRLWNVMIGTLPGEFRTVVAHHKRATSTNEDGQPSNYRPFTTATVRLSEAVGPFARLDVRNKSKIGHERLDDTRIKVDPGGYGLSGRGWSMSVAPQADHDLLRQVISGPFGQQLAAFGPGTYLGVAYGALFVHRPDYITEHLAAFVQAVTTMAHEVRSATTAKYPTQPFGGVLPPPAWWDAPAPPGPKVKRFLGATVISGGGDGVPRQAMGLDAPLPARLRAWIGEVAGGVGGQIEDARTFHLAFPSVPLPGQALAVIRLSLPAGPPARVVIVNEGHGNTSVAVVFESSRVPPDSSQDVLIAKLGNLVAARVPFDHVFTWDHSPGVDAAAVGHAVNRILAVVHGEGLFA